MVRVALVEVLGGVEKKKKPARTNFAKINA